MRCPVCTAQGQNDDCGLCRGTGSFTYEFMPCRRCRNRVDTRVDGNGVPVERRLCWFCENPPTVITIKTSQLIPCDPRRHDDIDGFIEAVRDDEAPPILLVKNSLAKRDVYFVADGHHRVGAAYLLQKDIKAIVMTEDDDLQRLPDRAPTKDCPTLRVLESKLRGWMKNTYGRQVSWRKYLKTPMPSYAPMLSLGSRFY